MLDFLFFTLSGRISVPLGAVVCLFFFGVHIMEQSNKSPFINAAGQNLLNQKQQRCWNALSGHPKWQAAFVAVCVANGRNWKRAIFAQFLTDANVSRVDDCHLPAIRAIRNSADERFFTAMN